MFTLALNIFDILEKIPIKIPPKVSNYFLFLFKYILITVIININIAPSVKALSIKLEVDPK
ncbi:hypothetical protein UT300005_16590 [Clostridium sp. CTA-5]